VKNVPLNPLRWVLQQFDGRKWHAAGILILAICFALGDWYETRMLGELVNAGAARVLDWTSAFIYLTLVFLTSTPLLIWSRRRLVENALVDLELRLAAKQATLDAQFYDRRNLKELHEELGKGIGGTHELMYTYLNSGLIVQIPLALMAGWYIAQFSLIALVFLVVFMFLFLWGGSKLGKKIAKEEREKSQQGTVMDASQQEVLTQIVFLQQQQAVGAANKLLRDRLKEVLAITNLLTNLYSVFRWLSGQASVVSAVVMMVVFLPDLVSGTLSPGTFMVLYMYCGQVTQPALGWGSIYAEVKSAWAEAEPLVKFFSEQPVVVDMDDAAELQPLSTSISFAGVSFAYQGNQGRPTLRNVSFAFPKGDMVALVGGSGGGKSTVAKLLLRQYDPVIGQILWDDIPLTAMKRSSLYGKIAYLPQDTPLFAGSVRKNVDLKGVHTDRDIVRVLQEAQADFALEPLGLERLVSELSGGQKQRLALARMLLQGAEVVVLDEATSALDQATERGIVETLDRLRKTHRLTLVVIAHRLSTILHADNIIVMKEG
jgi:ATP-binding cassette, subfamily B, heavy metal transporter